MLLGEGVAGAGLLVSGDAGVEDGPLRAVAVRVRHDYSSDFVSRRGSTPSAAANLRAVGIWGSVSLRSSLATVFNATPAFSASSPWVSACSIRRALSLSPIYTTACIVAISYPFSPHNSLQSCITKWLQL